VADGLVECDCAYDGIDGALVAFWLAILEARKAKRERERGGMEKEFLILTVICCMNRRCGVSNHSVIYDLRC
jgi:hypothetical protein